MEARHAGTREASGLFLVLCVGLFQRPNQDLLRRRSQGMATHLSVVWVASWLLLHAGDEVHEFTQIVLSMTKEVLHARADVFFL